MRTIVAGSRSVHDWLPVWEKLEKLRPPITLLISGMAAGPDTMGLDWAKKYDVPFECYPAQWRKFGKVAGFHRNIQMADRAERLVAFWDGRSRGTRHMIEVAREKGLIVEVVDAPTPR